MTAAAVVGAASPASGADAEVVETDVMIKTPDGEADAVVFRPVSGGPRPGVLVWPDIMSLRPVFRDMGRRLAQAGYVVLIPNIYYRAAGAPVVGDVFDFSKAEDRAKLDRLRATLTVDAVVRDAGAFLAFLDADPAVDKTRPIGTRGYCQGGPFAFRAAALAPDRVGAVASFHGAGLVSTEASAPHLLIPKTKAEFLIEIADNDDKRDPTAKDTLKAAFAAAGRPARVEVFSGANHGWTVRGSAVYDEVAAERAWSDLIGFYNRVLD